MINSEFKSKTEIVQAFPDEDACILHLETIRWSNGVFSPFDAESKIYKCKGHRYKCKNSEKYFNVKTGTLFDNTKISLQKWFLAIWIVTIQKKGIASQQLSNEIRVSQKTAWLMLQRIRDCFDVDDDTIKVQEDNSTQRAKNIPTFFD